MGEFGGLDCFWSDLDKNPKCPHGPTLLFGRHENGELKQFYACSACRDRKLCTFYAEKDVKLTEVKKKAWKEEAKKTMPYYNHRRLFIRFNEAMVESPEKRAYCHTCNKLVLFAERTEHASHDLQLGLTDEEMNNPTTILKPLANVKKEAQYLFAKKATTEITNMLLKAGAEQVLCIGAPRIHEHITQNFDHKMSSLLLDFDGRFHNFFGPLSYGLYNLFNHHFFTEEAAQTFQDFITQNKGKNTFVVCDPPFGGRVEAISQTFKTISDQHKKLNGIKDPEQELKFFFIFPYFMESIMQRKSNPAGVSGGLKDLKMSDYKVDYDNHPLFLTGSGGRKYGSPVRIFTNMSLKLLELPVEDRYKLCIKCQKWTSAENKHCKKCKSCTSKDGRTYKHCDLCQRCVKPTWKHCETCERCTLEKHACGGKPTISGRCFKCGASDHVGDDCGKVLEIQNERKRKNKANGIETVAKKQKISNASAKVEKSTKTGTVESSAFANKKKQKNQENGNVTATKKRKIAPLDDTAAPIAKHEKKLKKITKTASVESEELDNSKKSKKQTNETDSVAENGETDTTPALSAKEQKKLRRMMKKAPIEWVDVDNVKKAKNKTNGAVIAAKNKSNGAVIAAKNKSNGAVIAAKNKSNGAVIAAKNKSNGAVIAAKNKSNGAVIAAKNKKTKIPAEAATKVEKKRIKKKTPAEAVEVPTKKTSKVQSSKTVAELKASKNLQKNTMKKRKIKAT